MGRAVGFVGLGQMGLPMASRLVAAGATVRGADLSEEARRAFSSAGGLAVQSAREAAEGAAVLVTMLPNSRIVGEALCGSDGAVAALPQGAVVVDMSSSEPLETRKLGEELATRGLGFIDAPVSGGVRRAVTGTLAIMAGGDPVLIERVRPLFAALGSTIFLVGPLGAGHAMKALNNYVSAAGLAAASEALIVGGAFGLDPALMVDVLNSSTGRNNSTETKMKPFVLSGTFGSGFGMALMAKDIGIAAGLAAAQSQPLPGLSAAASLWAEAASAMPAGTDHTAIYRFLNAVADLKEG